MSPRDIDDTNSGRCGIAETIDLLGGRYKLHILRALLREGGPLRFGELRRALVSVSQKTLTRNLRDLETQHVLTRTAYAEVPPRVEYELTAKGSRLMPIFEAINVWADEYLA